jgi:hypothetical protein
MEKFGVADQENPKKRGLNQLSSYHNSSNKDNFAAHTAYRVNSAVKRPFLGAPSH